MDQTPEKQLDEFARLKAIFSSAVDFAIIATDRAGIVTDWNPGAERLLGWSAREMIGQPADRFFTPEDRCRQRVEREMQLSVQNGRADDERWHLRKGGDRFWASGEMFPLRDPSGAHIGYMKIVTDKTLAHLAGVELRESEERRRLAVEVGEIGLWEWDLQTGELSLDERMKMLNGVFEGRALSTDGAFDAIHADDRRRVERELQTLAAGGDDDRLELRYRVMGVEDGIERTVLVKARSIKGADGATVRLLGVARDISERVANETRRTILAQELSHRLKNTLAVVTSIITQTLRSSPDLETGRKTLLARVYALSKAHDILLSGQKDTANVRSVVQGAVALHDEGARVSLTGPNLPLGPKAALTLSLIVHELATNAGKYGGLSVPEGAVAVTWSVSRDEQNRPVLDFRWTEKNGPLVVPPTRTGFGSRLITMGLSGSTGGLVDLTYPTEGVVCRIVAPLVELMTEDEAGAAE